MPSTVIQPNAYGTAVGIITPVQIVAPNLTRRALIIHNPNTTTMWIAPIGQANNAAVAGPGSFAILSFGDRLFAGDTLATCGWLALMQTTPGNASVLEFI